jgi:hypothetical protein
MTIKVKFRVGQKVWVWQGPDEAGPYHQLLGPVEIYKIIVNATACVDANEEQKEVTYILSGLDDGYTEDQLFASLEEVLLRMKK